MNTRQQAKQTAAVQAGLLFMEEEDTDFLSASVALTLGVMIAAWQDMAVVMRACRDVSYDILADLAEDVVRCLQQLQSLGQ